MICATRSGRPSRSGGAVGVDLDRRAVPLGRRPELLCDLGRASSARSTGVRVDLHRVRRRASRGRAGRRSAWSAGRSARASSARTPPAPPGRGRPRRAARRSPPSEKIGVRSSCEALAMNSLRALSSRASRCCISLKVRASWPTSSVPSSGIGVEKSPSATFSAAASSRRRRCACARAASQPAASASEQGDPAGDQDLAPDQRHVVVDVGERRREDATQRGLPFRRRHRRLAAPLPADSSIAGAGLPARPAAAAAG